MPIPNTNTFTLKDVVDELQGSAYSGQSLIFLLNFAGDADFDPAYKGNKDRLSNFRNFDKP